MADDSKVTPKPYQNIQPLVGFLIASNACTLAELQTVYSFEDMLIMYEAIMIPRYNDWREAKASEKQWTKNCLIFMLDLPPRVSPS